MLGAWLNWKVLHDVFYKKTSPTSHIIVSLVPVFAVYTVCYPTVRGGGGVAQKLQHGGCGHIVYSSHPPQIMFLLHKKKKSFIWDIDSLMHWDHVSKVLDHLHFL